MSVFNIQNHPIIFEKPERVELPYSWVEHIPFAFFLIDILKPKILVELGVHTGNSFNAFCQAVKTLNVHTKCYGVDVWIGDEHAGFYDEKIFLNISNYQNVNYSNFSSLLRMTFDDASKRFENGSIDLLHIDGLHTYEAVKHDFEIWFPKISDQGVVIFHDTQVHGKGFGVYQFWNEISANYPHFEFKHGNGLGIIAVGKNINKSFLLFLETAEKDNYIQSLFFKMGSFIHSASESDSKIEELKIKEREIPSFKEKIKIQEELLFLKDNHIRNLESMLKLNKVKDIIFKLIIVLIFPLSFLHKKIQKKIRKIRAKKKYNYAYKLLNNKNEIKGEIKDFLIKPLISVVMPVYNVDPLWLKAAIDSVKNQWYENWEICIADDNSTNLSTINYLKSINDNRIKIKFLDQNKNISYASNEALKSASGDYVALLDHDDELTKDALYEVVKAINETGAELIYSDEDKVDTRGKFHDPHFKPDYSPDQLLSQNYICHLAVYKKSIIDAVGGFREGFEGSQDYDLVLRSVEKTKKIYHIPKVLYHWRMLPESTASQFNSKSYANEAARKALEETLQRRDIKGKVLAGEVPGIYQVKRDIIGNPLVSIIIPFKDKSELLKSCLDSILKKSSYKNFEIIGVSNNSVDPETSETMEKYETMDKRIRFYESNNSFNYSYLNNYGVSIAKGSHLILLNNDIEIITPDWIESLLEHSQREEVGVVGAKLYYVDDTLQHAGVIIGISGLAGHSHKYFKRSDYGYFSRLFIIQNLSAITGACMMVKKSIYQELNGLNEENLKIAFNDVDFCLRVREKGYLNVFTPFCEAYHYESISRGLENTPEKRERFNKEVAYMKKRHKEILKKGDPYYNPNLTLAVENFSINYKKRNFLNRLSFNLKIS